MWLAAGNYTLKTSGLVKQPANRKPHKITQMCPIDSCPQTTDTNRIAQILQKKNNKWTQPKGEMPLQPNKEISMYCV